MKILHAEDLLLVAKEVHETVGGQIGLFPLFWIVAWVDERMGLDAEARQNEIDQLVRYQMGATVNGELTNDAITFKAVHEHLRIVVSATTVAVQKARKEV
jgi:hypothetical protein